MTQISAAAVKALREKTQLPMMDCKRALLEADGDEEAAIRWLREQGMKTMSKRSGRATEAGRLAIFTSLDPGVGAMVELQCESASVAGHEEFVQLANDLTRQLAIGAGASTPEALWDQASPSKPNSSLKDECDDLSNRIREVFKLTRLIRIDAPCGGYLHHTGTDGVLLEIEGGTLEVAKEISMQIAAMKPKVVQREDLDPSDLQRERDILMEQARSEGKPENIIEKMVDGRMRVYYEETVLTEQRFVKDDKKTIGQLATENGLKPIRFVHWQLGSHV